MMSNIGTAEMNSLVSPRPGFRTAPLCDSSCAPALTAKLSRARVEAARRRFTPESLKEQRVQAGLANKRFFMNVTGNARKFQHHNRIRITHSGESPSLIFFRETDAWETWKTNEVAAA
jgi:hypothetical protein